MTSYDTVVFIRMHIVETMRWVISYDMAQPFLLLKMLQSPNKGRKTGGLRGEGDSIKFIDVRFDRR